MSYFRKISKIPDLLSLFHKDQRWLIVINADPDAMASAMALQRIMKGHVADVDIAKVNKLTRPDNLALARYMRLHMLDYTTELAAGYHRFALVDSQPSHHPHFQGIPFSIIIDHHPAPPECYSAPYTSIRPEYGATSTLLTEHLYNLKLRPGQLLSTALQFGIKTDTANFQRHFSEVDMRAYQYLAKFANSTLLARISRSEMHKAWLEFFAKACLNTRKAGTGEFVYVGQIASPDILVAVADFFTRVYEIRWVAVCGLHQETVVIIFRGDGLSKDLGAFAARQFSDLGSAGGHRVMARAEFATSALGQNEPETFVYKRLVSGTRKKADSKTAQAPRKPPASSLPGSSLPGSSLPGQHS